MKFVDRLKQSKVLVIGAGYSEFDYLPQYEGWSIKDENYIGISQIYCNQCITFEDGNPFNTNWEENDFLDLLQNTLKDKKFEQIWIDRGTVQHFLEPNINDRILSDIDEDFNSIDSSVIREKSKNLKVLHYLLENHATENCKFFMEIDSCNFGEFKGISYLEVCKKRATIPEMKNVCASIGNGAHQLITLSLKENLIFEEKTEAFRMIEFNTFKVLNTKQLLQEAHASVSSSNSERALIFNDYSNNDLNDDYRLARELQEKLNLPITSQERSDLQIARELQEQFDLEIAREFQQEEENQLATRQTMR